LLLSFGNEKKVRLHYYSSFFILLFHFSFTCPKEHLKEINTLNFLFLLLLPKEKEPKRKVTAV